MDRKRVLGVVIVLVAVSLGGVVAWQLLGEGAHEQATVTFVGEDGRELATVDATVADTLREQYVGLSDTPSLANGSGMLFVHSEEGNHTYVMRGMEYGLDIIFVGADGQITTIRHARPPREGEDGNDLQYPGRGKWVVEVPRGITNRTGIDVGDRVRITFGDGSRTGARVAPAERRNDYGRVVPGIDHGGERAIAVGPRRMADQGVRGPGPLRR